MGMKMTKKSGVQKSNPRKKIIDSLDREFSKYIRSIGYCEKCFRGKSVKLETAHYLTRKHLNIRWDKDNAICLCENCHKWSHRNPELFHFFVALLKKPYATERIKRLGYQEAKPIRTSTLKFLLKSMRLCNASGGREYENIEEF